MGKVTIEVDSKIDRFIQGFYECEAPPVPTTGWAADDWVKHIEAAGRWLNETKITRNGMEVKCYGLWRWDSNAILCGDWAGGMEMEEIWAEGADSWAHAVEQVTEWAAREGHTIHEMQAV